MTKNHLPDSFLMPNVLVDELMRDLTGNESKLLLYFLRIIRGFKISAEDITQITGLSKEEIDFAHQHLKEMDLFEDIDEQNAFNHLKEMGVNHE